MKINRRTPSLRVKSSLALTGLVGLSALAALPAQAQTIAITYSLGSFSFTQPVNPGSSFQLDVTSPKTLTLTSGVFQDVNAQVVRFTANQSSFNNENTGTASRSMTVNGVTGTISQLFDIATYTMDDLTLNPGSATVFDLGAQGKVSVTPRSFGFFGEAAGSYQSNVASRFLYTAAAPEPSQSAALGLGVLGLSALALRARSKRVQA